MMIEEFGAQVVSVWEGLRSTTRNLVVGALQSSSAGTGNISPARGGAAYDARADWELSRLLAALDKRALEAGVSLNAEQAQELRRMAETTASLLQSQTQSAEVFAQLVERAFGFKDYARIDALADALTERFAPSEICEVARSPHVVARALAQEALAQSPTTLLLGLLADPVDSEVARDALERQATDYGSEEARRIVHILNQVDLDEGDDDDA
jgi:hypothetical protein